MFLHAIVQLLLALLLSLSECAESQVKYGRINGFMCVNAAFIESHTEATGTIMCAGMCSQRSRCQAFTTAYGPCQLFVFDKYSKSVRDCSCSRRGLVFLKQRPGLELGALCPSGYGDDLCGIKYKMNFGYGNWSFQREICESESGLVILADVMDAAEMAQVDVLYSKYSSGVSFWLDGYQIPGSPEPGGGWYWVGCNITVDASLWGAGEPNELNAMYHENAVCRGSAPLAKLADSYEGDAGRRGLCECLTPFS